ncbi:hypothetical protein AGMMS50276_32840 [Synergistales bacterium]|nr:hypothetical protein AGMMS50276_32840 [Synergistales bacterium]
MAKLNVADIPGRNVKTTDNSKKKKRFDKDSLWKDLIDRFFYPLLKRALPELYEKADTKTKQRFLDKEFQDILNTADPDIHKSP